MPIPCETHPDRPAVILVTHPKHAEAPRDYFPHYLCDECRRTYAVFFEVEHVEVRPIVYLEAER